MWQGPQGAWEAQADLDPPVGATGPSPDACLDVLGRVVADRLSRSGSSADADAAAGLVLTVETIPTLAGVAEASEVMGWDKRRVVTYLDRGSFPAPLQTLRSGRVWVRADIERFAHAWRSRQEARRARKRARGDR